MDYNLVSVFKTFINEVSTIEKEYTEKLQICIKNTLTNLNNCKTDNYDEEIYKSFKGEQKESKNRYGNFDIIQISNKM